MHNVISMKRTSIETLTCKFSGVYPSRGNFYGYWKLEGFVWEEDALPSSHAPVVFHTNPCNQFWSVFKVPLNLCLLV